MARVRPSSSGKLRLLIGVLTKITRDAEMKIYADCSNSGLQTDDLYGERVIC